MFEGGKTKRSGAALADSAALLRELRWGDLAAQLAATRDLRGALGRKPGESSPLGRFKSLNAMSGDDVATPAGTVFAPEGSGTLGGPNSLSGLSPPTAAHDSQRDRRSS